MKSRKIYLVRHPETDWNRDRRYQGRTGRPLTGRGISSMQAVVDYSRDEAPDTIVSSPTAHARTVAERIAAEAGPGGEPVIDKAWCEIDHGLWEGCRHDEVIERFGGDAAAGRFDDPLEYTGHGGETLFEVDRRVSLSWDVLAASSGVAVVVSHATPIRVVLCRCLGIPVVQQWRFRIDNSSVTGITVADGAVTIDFVNHGLEP